MSGPTERVVSPVVCVGDDFQALIVQVRAAAHPAPLRLVAAADVSVGEMAGCADGVGLFGLSPLLVVLDAHTCPVEVLSAAAGAVVFVAPKLVSSLTSAARKGGWPVWRFNSPVGAAATARYASGVAAEHFPQVLPDVAGSVGSCYAGDTSAVWAALRTLGTVDASAQRELWERLRPPSDEEVVVSLLDGHTDPAKWLAVRAAKDPAWSAALAASRTGSDACVVAVAELLAGVTRTAARG